MREFTRAITLLVATIMAGTVIAGTLHPDLVGKLQSSGDTDLIRIFITLEDQADFSWLMSNTEALSKQEARRFVVSHLKDMTTSSQNDLRTFLDSQAALGKVKHLQSVWIVNALHGQATPEVIRDLDGFPGVAEVKWDSERYALFHDRPDPASVSGPDQTDEIAWGVSDINAPAVWQMGYTGAGIIVGMIDTGVNYNHMDLADHMWDGGPAYPNHGYDFHNNDNDPMDDGSSWMGGHGTHTAGSVGSDGTAGSNCGVAPDAIIMAIKVLDGNGYGSEGPVISGINFAVEQGADIFSMSLGFTSTSMHYEFRTACNNALAAGVIGAIAAGNEGNMQGWYPIPNNVRTPGNAPPPWLHPDQTLTGGLSCVVTCGATNIYQALAGFSSRGPVSWENVSPWFDYSYAGGSQMGLIDPDVSAPGEDVKSCWFMDIWGYADGWDGTSMATPHVAGTLALMLQKDPGLTPGDLDMYIETTAADWGPAGKDNDYGAGRINALAAVSAIPGGTTPDVSITMTPTGSTSLPSTGGTLYFDVNLQNHEDFAVPMTAWLDWTYPNGTWSDALILRNVTLPSGASIFRSLTATVAGSEPDGNYTLWAHEGSSYGGTIYSEDSFPFTKGMDGSVGGEWVSETAVYGWEEEVALTQIPEVHSLGHAYPNPFNPTTTIPFSLPEFGHVSLKVYDLSGRLAATILEGEISAGQYQVTFDGSHLSSGVYLYRLDAPGFSGTRKLMLVK
jgi:serine protease AprX